MKLRIKGDSLRLRITPSEMRTFIGEGRIAETIHFTPAAEARLTYAVEHVSEPGLSIRFRENEVAVLLPSAQARAWAETDEVGIYGSVPNGNGALEIAIEKDWACIDRNDTDNADTFPNPHEDAAC